MIVHLSTSNSNDRLPTGHWLKTWIFIIFGILFFIIFFELKLRDSGWVPSVVDSPQLWSIHRKSASKLGDKALILIGASRMQLDIDLATIRNSSSIEPVQLAIDGSSFMPVLEDLASDRDIKGTIIISTSMHNIKPKTIGDASIQWVKYYNKYFKQNNFIAPYKNFDNEIKSYVENHLALKLEGAMPATVILARAFDKFTLGNYLVTNNDRSRDADYSKVIMPDFYIKRVKRHFGEDLTPDENNISYERFLKTYQNAIEALKPVDNKVFLEGLDLLLEYIHQIESRGGKVILVRFPTDKLIREIDQKRYPRNIFWDVIAKKYNRTIHYADYPELSRFNLPDGSHLDYRDKQAFTNSLLNIIQRKFL